MVKLVTTNRTKECVAWWTFWGMEREGKFHKKSPLQELGRGSQGVAKLAKDAAGREFCVWENPDAGMEW